MVEDSGADELGDRVDEPGTTEPDGFDVPDHRQLDFTVDDLHALDRAVRGAHAAADLSGLERGPRRRGRGAPLCPRAANDPRVRAYVDEESRSLVDRQSPAQD